MKNFFLNLFVKFSGKITQGRKELFVLKKIVFFQLKKSKKTRRTQGNVRAHYHEEKQS